jgi:periplasmic protein TonB
VSDSTVIAELSRQREAHPPVRDRLMTTVFLVAILHAIVILGVTFSPAGHSGANAAQFLEVVLVKDPLPDASRNADAAYLAQVNQRGAGNSEDARGAQSPTLTAASAAASEGDSDDGRGAHANSKADRHEDLIASRAHSDQVWFSGPAESQAPAGAPLVFVPPGSIAQGLEQGDALKLAGKPSRELLITANTRETSGAEYLDSWRSHVEKVFALDPTRWYAVRNRHVSGNPTLEVQILSDGQLGQAIIRHSSGDPELDQTALDILKLAAPFAPFPARLAKNYDSLRIAYDWEFSDGELDRSTVRMPENSR